MEVALWLTVAISLGSFLIAFFIAFRFGIIYRKKIAESELGSAEEQAKKILNDAIKAAEAKKKETLIEAKEEIHKQRNELDREIKERRNELQKMEKRYLQKEENLDKKTESLEKKEENLKSREKLIEERTEQVNEIQKRQMEILEKISGLSKNEAKEFLIKNIEDEARLDAAVRIKEIEDSLKETADEKAREIISGAIQRCAADHVSDATVSVVPLANEDMKGRIIGREGRNIRSLEQITGIDFIIDDTPEAVILSGFDPIRREIARLTLEKLIQDGRIHPTRIEEMYNKSKKEVDAIIKKSGEDATFELGVHNVHPELIKLLGRLKYRTSYGQNVLNHSMEVAHLSGLIAGELGIDVNLAKRAGLLHDIGKSIDFEMEGSHVTIGADVARKYKEDAIVVNSILAHHGDVEPTSTIACIVAAADAVSAARPGARRENLENYIKRLQKLEEVATSFAGVEKAFAISAGREIRIMVKPENVNDDKMILVGKEIAKKIEEELEYPGQIKINLIRETRAVAFAK